MQEKLTKTMLLLFFIIIMPVMTGCLTEIPFDVKSETYNILLSEKDTYKEIKIKLPDEAMYNSTVIENGTIEYQIENLSTNAANIVLYISSESGASSTGDSILARGVGSEDASEGTVTSEKLIEMLTGDGFYIGMKCEDNSVVGVTFNLKVSGSYNIVQGLSQ